KLNSAAPGSAASSRNEALATSCSRAMGRLARATPRWSRVFIRDRPTRAAARAALRGLRALPPISARCALPRPRIDLTASVASVGLACARAGRTTALCRACVADVSKLSASPSVTVPAPVSSVVTTTTRTRRCSPGTAVASAAIADALGELTRRSEAQSSTCPSRAWNSSSEYTQKRVVDLGGCDVGRGRMRAAGLRAGRSPAPGRLRADGCRRSVVGATDSRRPRRTDLRVGGDVLIGRSCVLIRRGRRARDVGFVGQQRPQPGACALSDLAVLLARPPVPSAELRAGVSGDLRSEHEPLIDRQQRHDTSDAPQLITDDHLLIDSCPIVRDLDPFPCGGAQCLGLLERGQDRAATAERPATIARARKKPQLERICDVGPAGEGAAGLHMSDQLERGLAVAVLQILWTQPMSVHAQQQPALCRRDRRDLLAEIARAWASTVRKRALLGALSLFSASGRHIRMSLLIARRPPSQSRHSSPPGRPGSPMETRPLTSRTASTRSTAASSTRAVSASWRPCS